MINILINKNTKKIKILIQTTPIYTFWPATVAKFFKLKIFSKIFETIKKLDHQSFHKIKKIKYSKSRIFELHSEDLLSEEVR